MEEEPITAGGDKIKKRVANACLRCQKRKIRCDGETPSCTHCIEQSAQCEYTERRRRGPGKSKQYILMLEERLRKVESSIENLPAAEPSQEWTPISRPPDVDSRGHLGDNGTHLSSLSEGIPTGLQVEPTILLGPSPSATSTAGTQPASQAVSVSPEAPTGILESLDITNDIEFHTPYTEESQNPSLSLSKLPGSQSDVDLFRSQLDPSGFRRQVFASVENQFLLQHFIANALDDINVFYPLFTVESFSELLQQQVLAGPRNCDDNPSRWPIVNGLIATAIQWKTEPGAHGQLTPIAWGYSKNAFAIFPELLIRGSDISTCQGLLFIAMFMHGTADARTTSSVTASRESATGCRSTHYKVMMKQGLSSIFGNGIDLDLPTVGGPGDYTILGTQERINVLRCMAGLAMIQSRISAGLYSQRALKMSSTQLQSAVAELNHQLDSWKMSLPAHIRPTYDSYPSISQLELPVLLLTIMYYTAAGRINMATTRHGHSSNDAFDLLAQVPVAAARSTLRLVQTMSPPPFSLSWYTCLFKLQFFQANIRKGK
ncbi:fungal specific transcription factor factor domain-containing protein [Fusarium mexicanum]|uniref:Fungal specific transcription factor factor domain-containing protein n=1 Tax=Fusarium mexicanum TaxID=751941 RepID=A0A8H5N5S8_9HYPO|nr:fungal specific transcription factor factor domain-containing protein [Fusarium mexicanum]